MLCDEGVAPFVVAITVTGSQLLLPIHPKEFMLRPHDEQTTSNQSEVNGETLVGSEPPEPVIFLRKMG